MTIHDEYLYHYEKFSKKYGKKTIVFIQVGSFHEAYGTDDRGPDLEYVSNLLNIILTKKDKKKESSVKNPYMAGVPSHSIVKYINILMNDGFTVVMIDQVTPAPNPTRKVTGIYSPGTYIEESFSSDSNNIVCLSIEDELQRDGKILLCVGMSVIDLSTGENTVHEAYSFNGDEKYALDEATKFINSYKPKEIIIYRPNPERKFKKIQKKIKIDGNAMSNEKLVQYLEIDNKNYNFFKLVKPQFYKVSYQKEFLEKIFKNHGMMNVIEYLDMEKMPYARVSYILLLEFAYQHNENIINNIYDPVIYENYQHLNLGNNAALQLNVFETDDAKHAKNRFKSLFDVVNNTSTAMGRRYLKQMLNAPLVSPTQLKLSYDCIEELMTNQDFFNTIETNLKYIGDLERSQRKLSLKMLHPIHMANLIKSYYAVKEVSVAINSCKFKNIKKTSPNSNIIKTINEFIKECEDIFIMDELEKYHINDIQNSIFKLGKFSEIDNIQKDISCGMNFMNNLCKVLSSHVADVGIAKKLESEGDLKIKIKKNERDGYYLLLTKLRSMSLKKNLAKISYIQITENECVLPSELIYKDLPKGKQTKIFLDKMEIHSNNIIVKRNKITSMVKNAYVKVLDNLYKKYKLLFRDVTTFISKLDFIKSAAKTAILFNYCKPTVVKSQNTSNINGEKSNHLGYGFIRAIGLRHPIVERITVDSEYIPHDINLGKHKENKKDKWPLDGIMLFGLNSAGKSTIQKAIGLSVIMAQSGMYVPASGYTFSPYDSLFTRITSNDNIFKGLSSFALEMTELRAILKRTGSRTLVIGDEVCRGTEPISGNSLVAATIIQLAKTGSSFIFATHLHDIPNITKIKELNNVKSYHLSVQIENDELVFDRILKEGSGDSIYGITVAKHIIHDSDFINLAQSIKNELLQQPNTILNTKQSRYNSDIYVDHCAVCGDRKNISGYFETHHINHQKDCNEFGFVKNKGKKHIKKNDKCNLVPLCEKCHDDVHDGKINISGYIETSSGKKLNVEKIDLIDIEKDDIDIDIDDSESQSESESYSDSDVIIITKKNKMHYSIRSKRKKYGKKDINKINKFKSDGLSLLKAKRLIKDKYGLNVGTATIKKIWENSY
jgi:DNA mismatch repair protein MutS